MEYNEERKQPFYFNDEGYLVVESNKGIIVDGQQYSKLHGLFTCNARTIGLIISHFTGIPVRWNKFIKKETVKLNEFITEETVIDDSEQSYTVMLDSNFDVEKYKNEIYESIVQSVRKSFEKDINNIQDERDECQQERDSLLKSIKNYNEKSLIYRLFHRVKINERIYS